MTDSTRSDHRSSINVSMPSKAKPSNKAPLQAPRQLARIQLDTLVGMGIDPERPWRDGHPDLLTCSGSPASYRRTFCFYGFALGIVGTGMLALPVLAGSAAYALGETLHWRVGLAQRPGRAPAFYITIAAATLVGAALNFTPLDPVKALIWSAIINGVAAVPTMAMIMLMASRALVQIAGAGKRPVVYCRDFKLGARHSTLQAQVDLGHPDVPVRIVPCGCDASMPAAPAPIPYQSLAEAL
jgi:hypothetical protein